jgi:hypothetical protein
VVRISISVSVYATAKLLQGRNYFFFFEPGTAFGGGLALVCGSALLGPRGSFFFSPAMPQY